MNKTSVLLLAVLFSYANSAFADSDMFRTIEEFEVTQKDRILKAARYPTYFTVNNVAPCDPTDCRHPCQKAAECYLNPKFNGEPVWAEQPF